MVDSGSTEIVRGEWKEGIDFSLARSIDCFKYIFQAAGYSASVMERWRPDEADCAILATCLTREDCLPRPRHTECKGAKEPSEWKTKEAVEVQEQQVDDEVPNPTVNTEESGIEAKGQDAEAKQEPLGAEIVPIFAEEALPRVEGL